MAIHNNLADVELHEPLGVATAVADRVYISNGVAGGAWSKFHADNTVLVNSMADFPAAVAGVITVADRTAYHIGTALTTSDRFELGVESVITAVGGRIAKITYTGTGTLFTGAGTGFTGAGVTAFTLDHVGIELSNAAGTMLDLTGTGATVALFIDDVLVEGIGTLGNLTDIAVFATNRCTALCNQGFSFFETETIARIFVMSYWQVITSSITFEFLDLGTALYQSLLLDHMNIFAPSGAIGFKGAVASANLATGSVADMSAIALTGGVTTLNGIGNDDIRWEFEDVTGVPDSRKAAESYLLTLETVTIAATSTFVAIAGANWQSDVAARFTTSTAGILTYISEVDTTFLVTGTAGISKVGGGTDQLELRIAKNGTTLPKSGSVTANSAVTSVNSQSLVELTTGDTLQLFVANNTTTANIDVVMSNITARATG